MNGPVAEALATSPDLRERFEAFRNAANEALGEELTAQVRHAVAQVHGIKTPAPAGTAPPAALAYARRIPFQHTAITDEEAAAVVAELGEEGFVAFSVVAALADAECRAEKVGLASLAAG
jgi:hypothetical protein